MKSFDEYRLSSKAWIATAALLAIAFFVAGITMLADLPTYGLSSAITFSAAGGTLLWLALHSLRA